jgi:hypothetical protein
MGSKKSRGIFEKHRKLILEQLRGIAPAAVELGKEALPTLSH